MRRFLGEEEGLTTVEYALLLALLVAAVLGVWAALGGKVQASVSTSAKTLGATLPG